MQNRMPSTCPRCSGKMVSCSDWLGEYGSCLLCGYAYEPRRFDADALRREVEAELQRESVALPCRLATRDFRFVRRR